MIVDFFEAGRFLGGMVSGGEYFWWWIMVDFFVWWRIFWGWRSMVVGNGGWLHSLFQPAYFSADQVFAGRFVHF